MTLVIIPVFGHFAIIWKGRETHKVLLRLSWLEQERSRVIIRFAQMKCIKTRTRGQEEKKQKDRNNHFSPVY